MSLIARCLLLLPLLCLQSFALAQEAPPLSAGQSLYLSVYSHLYHGEVQRKTGKPSETLVSTHVSVRNTDLKAPLKVTSARYYNTEGKLLREYLSAPQTIPPLGTYELFVPRTPTGPSTRRSSKRCMPISARRAPCCS